MKNSGIASFFWRAEWSQSLVEKYRAVVLQKNPKVAINFVLMAKKKLKKISEDFGIKNSEQKGLQQTLEEKGFNVAGLHVNQSWRF